MPTLGTLKKQVAELSDTARVNCLNMIAYTISITGAPGPSGFLMRADSEYSYASWAYNEAKKINYKKGLIDALLGEASSKRLRAFGLRWEGKTDSPTVIAQKEYLSEASALAEELSDDDELGKVFLAMDGLNKDNSSDFLKKSADYFHKAGDEQKEGEVCTWIAEGYLYKGFYEDAFEYGQRGLLLNRKAASDAKTKEEQDWRNYLYQQSLADIATLYKEAGDYQSSLQCLNEASQFGVERKTGWDMIGEKAEIFRLTGAYDSAFYFLRKQLKNNPDDRFTMRDIGATFLMAKQYDSALAIFMEVLPEFRKIDNANGQVLVPILYYIGSAYAGKKEYKKALSYATDAVTSALISGRRPDMMNGYELLSGVYHQLGNNDSAYHYLLKSSLLKDSIQNRQFLFRLNSYKKAAEDVKKAARVSLLDRDNKLKTVQIKQESRQKNFLLVLLSALMLTGFFVYRSIYLKRKNEKLKHAQLENEMKLQQMENEKKQAEFHQQVAELEMQALRAQMNPHFIFNCLSSINRFILKNESKAASGYLTRFSRLMRMVLINSQKQLITLEEELEMLRIYLEMERLRFKDSFDYGITLLNEINSETVFIPPLLLQPFCENAIWHGLMHTEGHGRLDIELSMKENILHCIITDNGIGREKAAEMRSKTAEKEKSMGLKITTERLALLNRQKGVATFFDIEDVINENGIVCGTKVILKISLKEAAEEIV